MHDSFLAYFGHLNIDISIKVDKIPLSGSTPAKSVEETFGGTAGNFAIIANRLGVPFHLYSAVSQKTHAEFLQFLESEGIDTKHISVHHDAYGPVCYIASDKEKQVAYIYQGPMEDWSSPDTFTDTSIYEWAHFCTGPPMEYLKVAENMERTRIVFDPGQELSYRYDHESASRFLELSSLFMGNSDEYETLVKLMKTNKKDLKKACSNIIVTQGSRGVYAVIDEQEYNFRTPKVESFHDTIGAGDSFRAGLYYGLYRKHKMVDSIIYGIVIASEAIRSPISEFQLSPKELENRVSVLREEILEI